MGPTGLGFCARPAHQLSALPPEGENSEEIDLQYAAKRQEHGRWELHQAVFDGVDKAWGQVGQSRQVQSGQSSLAAKLCDALAHVLEPPSGVVFRITDHPSLVQHDVNEKLQSNAVWHWSHQRWGTAERTFDWLALSI